MWASYVGTAYYRPHGIFDNGWKRVATACSTNPESVKLYVNGEDMGYCQGNILN